jgi:hypothetical protein
MQRYCRLVPVGIIERGDFHELQIRARGDESLHEVAGFLDALALRIMQRYESQPFGELLEIAPGYLENPAPKKHFYRRLFDEDGRYKSDFITIASEVIGAWIEEELGAEKVEVASKLGLSLSSSEQLRQLLAERQNIFDIFGSDQRQEQFSVLLSASLQLPEIRKGSLQKQVNPQAHFAPLMKWIGGESYQAILNAARDSGVLLMKDDITDAVKYASDMSTWLSWAFGAAHSLLRSMIQDLDPYFGILPLLVKYGVPTMAGAYISLLGISDRTAAKDFSNRFEQLKQYPTLRRISDWLDSIEGDDIKRMLEAEDHGLRTELVTKQVFRGKSSVYPYRMSRLIAALDLPAGAILTARQEGERVVLLHDESIVGELIDRDTRLFFNQNTLSLLVAVPVSDVLSSHTGRVAIVEPAKI